ncbi:hypothetical protein GQ600_24639 [Phytophthora cactorum]|nr:hypothetical protein GQ600_24639 [Phytophthora cactorum]
MIRMSSKYGAYEADVLAQMKHAITNMTYARTEADYATHRGKFKRHVSHGISNRFASLQESHEQPRGEPVRQSEAADEGAFFLALQLESYAIFSEAQRGEYYAKV